MAIERPQRCRSRCFRRECSLVGLSLRRKPGATKVAEDCAVGTGEVNTYPCSTALVGVESSVGFTSAASDREPSAKA